MRVGRLLICVPTTNNDSLLLLLLLLLLFLRPPPTTKRPLGVFVAPALICRVKVTCACASMTCRRRCSNDSLNKTRKVSKIFHSCNESHLCYARLDSPRSHSKTASRKVAKMCWGKYSAMIVSEESSTRSLHTQPLHEIRRVCGVMPSVFACRIPSRIDENVTMSTRSEQTARRTRWR